MTMLKAVLIFILIVSTMTTFLMLSSNTFQFSFSSLSHSMYLPVIAQGNGNQEEELSTESSELDNNIAGSIDDTSKDDQQDTKNLDDPEEIGVDDDKSKSPTEEREGGGTIPKPDFPSDCPSGSRFEVFPPPRGKECLPCIPDVDPSPECSGSASSITTQQQEDEIGQQKEQPVNNSGLRPGDPIPDVPVG
jgi:hypothetical protein